MYEHNELLPLMTLAEAIQHAEDIANDKAICDSCRAEHRQLADWLKELSDYRTEPENNPLTLEELKTENKRLKAQLAHLKGSLELVGRIKQTEGTAPDNKPTLTSENLSTLFQNIGDRAQGGLNP